MKPIDVKYYPLPNGEFVVSYFDYLRRYRVMNTFKDEAKATEEFNKLRMWKPVKEEKRSLVNCTVEELMTVFLNEIPEATLGKSPQLIRDFLDQFSFYKIDQIDEVTMRSFYQRQKLEYDYTSHSLATRKYQIQGFFKWLKFRGLIEDSPQSNISMGRSKVYRRRSIWVKQDSIKKFVQDTNLLSPGFLYPMVLLISETAAKTSDLINLKWRDLDIKNKKVHLQASDKIQHRQLDISDELVTAIKKIDQISENIFTNLEGRPLRKEVLVRELRILKRKLGITEDWVFRDLRYSFGINFLKAGGQMITLKEIMGHHHVRMTEELFGQFVIHDADFFDAQVVPETGSSSSEIYKFREFSEFFEKSRP